MRILRALSTILVLALAGCGIGTISISISPKQATVNANTDTQFSASVGNAGNKTVIWSATGGTVTDTGLFTAPEVAGFYSVVATSQADPSATSTAVVTVVTPVVLTPGRVSLTVNATQLFTALIPATNSTSVTWSIQEAATGGTIDATGLYTAPAVAGIYHVVGTSAADPTQIGVAIVTVTP